MRKGSPRGYLFSLGHSGERGSNDRGLLTEECRWGRRYCVEAGVRGQEVVDSGHASWLIEEFELNVALSAREAIGEF